MQFPICTLYIFSVGVVGGLVNSLITDNGFAFPKRIEHSGLSIMRPGVLGNCLVSGVAAFISWGLYSSAATTPITSASTDASSQFHLTPGILAGALLVGISGARWLTSEVDKTLLQAAAAEAAKADASLSLSQRVALATPAEALKICTKLVSLTEGNDAPSTAPNPATPADA